MKLLLPIAAAAALAGCVLAPMDNELRERGTRFERAMSKDPQEVVRCIHGNTAGKSELSRGDLRSMRLGTEELRVREAEKTIALFELAPRSPGTTAVAWFAPTSMPADHAAFDRYLRGC